MNQPKVTYKFIRDEREFYCNWHGWLEVYEDGVLIARKEQQYLMKEWEIAQLQSHEPKPGQMMPWGDPRWYTHCQQCGKEVDPQTAKYLEAQYHPECYDLAWYRYWRRRNYM